MKAYEVNFDGLVGLTHHYAGLSFGNVASTSNQNMESNPKLAAQQGLLKMKALSDMGFKQAVLPPQERPHLSLLRQLGFSGSDQQVLAAVAKHSPQLLSQVSSASSMWTANAATMSPSADTHDGRAHFTVANLNNKFHRAIEADTTSATLKAIFNHDDYFVHHDALPQQALWGDEGAANHNRLCADYGYKGVEVFVYGRQALSSGVEPTRYPARQTLEASQAIARLHGLTPEQTVFVQQNPDVIDQGVFHNDVISVSNGPVLFHHQAAFLDAKSAFAEIGRKLAELNTDFIPIEVPSKQVSVQDAVETYLFNSQLLTKANGKMLLVVPEESRQHPRVWQYLSDLISRDYPIDEVKVFDLRESMRNGGGPACLRQRVVLTQSELNAITPQVLMTESLFTSLNAWIERFYRDRLRESDLADPQLLMENRQALDELTQILNLGSLYPFQQI